MCNITHLMMVLLVGGIGTINAIVQIMTDKTSYSIGDKAIITCTNTDRSGVMFQRQNSNITRCLGTTNVCYNFAVNGYQWASYYQENPSRFELQFKVDAETEGWFSCHDAVNSSQKDEVHVTLGSTYLVGSIVGCLLQVLLCLTLSRALVATI